MENNENVVEETTENVEAQTTEEMEEAEVEEQIEDTEESETDEDVEEVEVPELEKPTEEVQEAEPVEETEEAKPKYTDEQLDEIISRKLARQRKKLDKEYRKKYSRLETVVNAGLGTDNVEDATEKLTEFYEENGISIPSSNQSKFSDDEIQLLANAEADRFINESTYKELVDEVYDIEQTMKEDELTDREKLYYQRLKNELDRQDDEKAVLSLGISLSDLEKEDVKEYFAKLNPNLSTKEKYEMYLSSKPKKEPKKMGSMKSGTQNEVKDFYTPEEIEKLTDAELDDPKVWEAVRKSMTNKKYKNYYE